jgi:phage terminase Nu1 subunit (DNA packaging protein)
MAEAGVGSDGTVYDEKLERARLLHHQANNEALKEKTARGELLRSDLVIDLGAVLVAAARTRMLSITSKVRGRFPELEKEVSDEIDSLIREALTELGDDGIHSDIRRRIAPTVLGVETAA